MPRLPDEVTAAPALALLAQLPGQVAVIDPTGRLLAVNAGWRRFAQAEGHAPAPVRDDNYLAVCDAARGEGAPEAQAAAAGLREVLAGRRQEFDLDYPCHSATQRRWFRMQAVPLQWNGMPAALVMHSDITALRQARDEVLRLNASLERRVQRRTRQLEAVNRDLEAFSYSVSHDLKAPLAAIDGFTHALQERLQGRLDARETGYLERVRAGVGNMNALIDAMLALHQVAHAVPMRRQPVDLSALARSIVDELHALDPQRVVVAQIEPGIRVHGDASLLTTALRNLIGNAWKFSSQRPQVELDVRQDWDAPLGFVSVRIADRGAGFDPQLADRLFVPFQRLHPRSEFPGNGIGLTTVQRIVQRHGGSMRAQGRPGEGATFWINLPESFGDSADSNRYD